MLVSVAGDLFMLAHVTCSANGRGYLFEVHLGHTKLKVW